MNDEASAQKNAKRVVNGWLKELRRQHGPHWNNMSSIDRDRAIESKILHHTLAWQAGSMTWNDIRTEIQRLMVAYYGEPEVPQQQYVVIEKRGFDILSVRGPLNREKALDFAQELAQEQTESSAKRLNASAKELEETGEWQNGTGYAVCLHEFEKR